MNLPLAQIELFSDRKIILNGVVHTKMCTDENYPLYGSYAPINVKPHLCIIYKGRVGIINVCPMGWVLRA